MKKLAVLAIAALVSASAFAETGMGYSYINLNGTWYACGGDTGDWTSSLRLGSDEDGAYVAGVPDLGQFVGNSLSIGGQIQLWEYYEGRPNVEWGDDSKVTMFVSIDGAQAEAIDLYKASFDGSNNHFESGGATWTPVAVDITPGEHTLAVWFGQTDVNVWDSNNSKNYNATFSSIPEPATMSLLGLGALAMVLRRKLRK